MSGSISDLSAEIGPGDPLSTRGRHQATLATLRLSHLRDASRLSFGEQIHNISPSCAMGMWQEAGFGMNRHT